jgi:hypothetical protein
LPSSSVVAEEGSTKTPENTEFTNTDKPEEREREGRKLHLVPLRVWLCGKRFAMTHGGKGGVLVGRWVKCE